MNFIKSIVFMIALSGFSSFAFGDLAEDLSQVKLHRTYYSLWLETPTSEQFEVWFQFTNESGFLEWKVFQLAIPTEAAAQNITKDKYLSTNHFYAGYPAPPPNYTPVPTFLRGYEEGIINSVRRNHSELALKQIQVHYFGKYARLYVNEIIPFSQEPNPLDRYFFKGFRFFFADLKNAVLRDNHTGYTAISRLGFLLDRREVSRSSGWLDFILPPGMEGSSLFLLEHLSWDLPQLVLPPRYLEARASLERTIVMAARQLEQVPETKIPLQTVLAHQENSLLPSYFEQTLIFRIPFYGRTADFNKQYNGVMKLLIPVRLGRFYREAQDAATGLKFAVDGELSLQHLSLNLSVKGVDGRVVQKQFIAAGPQQFGLIQSGNLFAVAGLTTLSSDSSELNLPGSGIYTEFDIYPDLMIFPLALTGLNL